MSQPLDTIFNLYKRSTEVQHKTLLTSQWQLLYVLYPWTNQRVCLLRVKFFCSHLLFQVFVPRRRRWGKMWVILNCDCLIKPDQAVTHLSDNLWWWGAGKSKTDSLSENLSSLIKGQVQFRQCTRNVHWYTATESPDPDEKCAADLKWHAEGTSAV